VKAITVLLAANLFVFLHTALAQTTSNATQNASSASANSQTPGATAPPRPLTLKEAEAIAVRNNPQITVGKLLALQAQQYVREVRAGLMPQVAVNLTGVESNNGNRLGSGYLTDGRIFTRAAGGATFSQLITDFGRTWNLLSNSQYQEKAAEQNAVATTQQIVLVVDQSFYNALETKALLRVAEDTVNARQLFVDQIQALTNAKLKSEVDLAFAKVDLARANLLFLDAQNNYQASLSTLSAVLGYPDRQDFAPEEPAEQISPPALDATPLIQQALNLRPEVRSLRDQVTAAEKFARAEHDLFWPTVSALGVVGDSPLHDTGYGSSSWYGAIGVNINIPVFNGFLYNARAKSADLQINVRQKQLQDLQNNVARDVRNSWLDTQEAYHRLTVTQQLQEQANLALELAQARYKLGLGTIVEFSQAQLQKTDADIADTDARYRYAVSQLVLGFQMGLTR
jgi:outer membrane protein